jgi:hypothetical protein
VSNQEISQATRGGGSGCGGGFGQRIVDDAVAAEVHGASHWHKRRTVLVVTVATAAKTPWLVLMMIRRCRRRRRVTMTMSASAIAVKTQGLA